MSNFDTPISKFARRMEDRPSQSMELVIYLWNKPRVNALIHIGIESEGSSSLFGCVVVEASSSLPA